MIWLSHASSRNGRYRRLKTPEFVARLNELKARGLEQTVAQLGQLSTQAASTLEKLLAAKSETVRLGAVRVVIELGLRLREQVELEQRIRDLETASLAPLQVQHRRSA